MSTISYSAMVNGNVGENFYPTRGLRQGDLVSPFLFLICGEGLSCLMRLAIREGLLKGVKVSRSGPKVSHLLFVDDCILFKEATKRGACVIKEILWEYKNGSGQYVNFEKSAVFFSKNTSEEDRQLVINQLGVRSSNDLERYLGLLSLVGRRKKGIFSSFER
ncbi:hypothetical protein PVK06_016862 [Gossypium arboreum]|uniref:Reverse transcriptase domain-containing protein n=1 Tax=Gossypium arboreum TaxID=29729 RepID=A0ABR0Q1C4_GOSAR|nr:hypothetical protein PVK06_016862 [Gossypium arboreum]